MTKYVASFQQWQAWAEEQGVHSLRSGGVSMAAAAGVPDRLIQRHGGWRSESGMKAYFEESLPNLLKVSQAIGQLQV